MYNKKIDLHLIKKIKDYYKKNTTNSHLINYSLISNTNGKIFIWIWLYSFNKFIKITFIILKELLMSLKIKIYKCHGKFSKNKKKLIISWAFKKNFKKNGEYIDQYFNISSRKNKDINWFLIYMDEILPKKYDENIILFAQQTKKNQFSIINFFKHLFKNFINSKFSLFKFVILISPFSNFSQVLLQNIKPYINNKTEKILTPFEGQPFQNEVNLYVKKKYKNIISIGYVHAPPFSIPVNFIKNYSSPNKLIVNGSAQKKIFTKYLGWSNKDIKLLPSLRFFKKTKIMNGSIFLPLKIYDYKKILLDFKFFFNFLLFKIPLLEVKNHPLSMSSCENIKLLESLNSFLSINKKRFLKKESKKLSIFIGNTGSILEALERNIEVIHYTEDSLLQSYDNNLWKGIKSKKIYNNFYQYSLEKKNSLINLGILNNKLIKKYKL